MEKYIRQKVIGKGSYGQAVVVKRRTDGALLVVKEVRLQGLKMEERREARAECELLGRLKHPNIVQYMEHFEQRQVLYIAMEFAEKGDLDGMLKKYTKQHGYTGRGVSQDQALHYFAQICMAMRYLHEKKILHRDIKCANIFLTASNVVKIGDFGISTILRNTFALARTVCGTPYYFSPELCQNRPYNNKSDVWAIGCVFYELLTLKHPFDGHNMKQLMQRIVKGNPAPISSFYDLDIRNLCGSLLQKNDKVRPNVGQILALPVMRGALERLQQGLGRAATEKEKLPNFRDMVNRHAQVHPVGGNPAVRAAPRADPKPGRMSPRGAGINMARGGQRGVTPPPDSKAAQDLAKREREKKLEQQIAERKLEAQIAEKAKGVAKWHQAEQNRHKAPDPLPRKNNSPSPAPAPRGRNNSPAPANKRRVSAPVTSPTNQPISLSPQQRAFAHSPKADHGRRKNQNVPAAPSRAEVSPKYEDRKDSPRGPSPPSHGRRASVGGTPPPEQKRPAPIEKDRGSEGSDSEAVDVQSSDSEEEEPDTDHQKQVRDQEYDAMLKNIDKALTAKPNNDEDFEDAEDGSGGGGGDAKDPKFLLDGATLRLDVPRAAPLSERLEVLRQFIDSHLGTDLFLKAYKMISELDNTTEVLQSVDKLLGESKKQMTPLICQLVFCDDQMNTTH